jgi:hypothetical protein
MKANDKYKKLIDILTPALKEKGFTKYRHRFYLRIENNWGIIDFQKSTKSTSNSVIFTVNLGIASKRILEKFSQIPEGKKPDIWDCQWQVRLGHVLGINKDLWWTINEETSIDQLSEQLKEYILDYGVPEILKYISDDSLRDLWLSGKSPSLTKIQRLRYLSILLKEIGPQNLLDTIKSER